MPGASANFACLLKATSAPPQAAPSSWYCAGEAGIGKTRLARRFLAWSGAQGAELLQGGAYESGSHLPFQPLVDALRQRLEHENSLRDLLDDVWLSPLSQLLPELRQHYPSLPPAPLIHPHPETDKSQAQFYEPLVQYSLALAKRAPLVLFLDDLQWDRQRNFGPVAICHPTLAR